MAVVYKLEGGALIVIPENVRVAVINPTNIIAAPIASCQLAYDYVIGLRELADAIEQADRELGSKLVIPNYSSVIAHSTQ